MTTSKESPLDLPLLSQLSTHDSSPGSPELIFISREDLPNRIRLPPIPARIDSTNTLKVLDSDTPGREERGRGIFVSEALKTGDLIFKIKEPLIVIADDGARALSTSCDNCFATVIHLQDGGKLCACKVVYYCNKECQKEAWFHHHKCECKSYKAIKADPEAIDIEGNPAILHAKTRYIFRLAQMYKKDLISKSEWQEFEDLNPAEKFRMREWPNFAEYCGLLCEIVKKFIDIDWDITSIGFQIFSMQQNKIAALVPLLKGECKLWDSKLKCVAHFGYFVDPFVSMINHSCDSNAWCVLDGKELHVRATKDIAAGEEITLCYATKGRNDYERRTKNLKHYWGIDCKCSLCAKGLLGPTGDLRDNILKAMDDHTTSLTVIERLIGELKSYGFEYRDQLMRGLHIMARRAHLAQKNAGKALQMSLRIHYLIEPVLIPPTPLEDRLVTLANIIAHTDYPVPLLGLEDVPQNIRKLMPRLKRNLRRILVEGTEKCFGVDSSVAQFERKSLASFIQLEDDMREARGGLLQGESADEVSREKLEFTEKMNEVLKWAGVPEHTHEQLLL